MKASKILARPFAAALGIAVLAAVPANAADVVFQEPPAPQPSAPMDFGPIATWTGPYAGLQFGYGFSGRVGNDTTGNITTDGWYGGAFAGYNFQHDMFVYGVEADVNYTRFTGSTAAGDDARTGIDGSLRARLGAALTDDILIYGTGGIAGQRLTVDPNVVGLDSDTQALVGFTVGAGMDARLTDQVFGRVEYRYTQYSNRNFDFGAGSESVSSRDHRVGVGLGVKF
ncbi:outer membrane beta-barrel protein [Chelativorans sp. ZYF759]|uniref:outer membrane protein n=1 Tax=Chelativorans sp. ZYF759 TaxID=2692213 RepID=UPI00145D6E32|nr:outer membrane protein [Chelativorans sp. ZYF759]NMG38718.1 outer membrane beta-barrel protein [Chelativorans sp. ZYF759]